MKQKKTATDKCSEFRGKRFAGDLSTHTAETSIGLSSHRCGREQVRGVDDKIARKMTTLETQYMA
jgi:hypothetical protein